MRFLADMRRLEPVLGSRRGGFERFPDQRLGANTTDPMGDSGMAAFSVFFRQNPSFLAHQRHVAEGHGGCNCARLFGIAKIPSDNHIRALLDPASPTLLQPVFAETLNQLQRLDGGLDVFRRRGGHRLIALDGGPYDGSRTIHGPNCAARQHGKDGPQYHPAMRAATLVAPGHDKVIPLEPAFIVSQAGTEKPDCETMAARRWLAAHGQRSADLDAVYLGADLLSRQPLCQAVLEVGGYFIFVGKPALHPLIEEDLTGTDLPVLEQTVRRGKPRFIHPDRWLRDGPLRDGREALTVNWFEIEIMTAKGETTCRNSFVTDRPVGPDTVVERAACGRARWKIENETFNLLQNNGYHLEHRCGHGKQNLSAIRLSLNLVAFAMHTVCDIGDEPWRAARPKLGPRYNVFGKRAAITIDLIFASWDDRLLTLAFAKPPPVPP